MGHFYRDKQTASVLKDKINQIITRELQDPKIKTELITITNITVSKDLKVADVYVSIFTADEKDRARIFSSLKNSSSFVRKRLGPMIRARFTPEVRFKEDTSLRDGADLYHKINNINSDSR